MLADQFSFFGSDFIFYCAAAALCGIQDCKPNRVAMPCGFCQYSIFVLFGIGKLCVMLCHALKHIDALAHIDNTSVQQNSIDTRPLKRGC